MKAGIHILSFILLCFLNVFCVKQMVVFHKDQESLSISYLALLPERAARIVSLEFPGIFSDYLMLNTLTYMGEKVLANKAMTDDEWQKTYQALKQVINLDPRSTDAFTLAETTLPWDAGMVEETNELLLKVAEVQTSNPRPYFFLWFNHYYFLKDTKKAGYYLQKAARIPGTPKYYTTLAARMNMMAGQLPESILFLEEMIRETRDQKSKKYLETRLLAIRMIHFLEQNIQRYRNIYNKKPEELEDLITNQLIKAIPKDPYGGTFYIMENGRVYTTSKLVHSPQKPTP